MALTMPRSQSKVESSESLRATPPLFTLPLHIVGNILCELGSLEHLPDVISSHPIFYTAFKEFPAMARDALREQIIDDETFILALFAHESKPRRRRSISSRDFLEAYSHKPAKLISKHRFVKLSAALRISQLYSLVTELRNAFIEETLPHLYGEDQWHQVTEQARELSREEIRRIDRALYRFQIYCNLFGDQFRRGVDETQLKRVFFERHSSWVNEQLSCVQDFLEAQLTKSINQVAAHDPERAAFLTTGGVGRSKQHYLSLGLEFLHQLRTASNTDKKLELFIDAADLIEELPTPPTPEIESSFEFALEAPPCDWSEHISKMARETDKDSGPMLIWKDVHSTGSRDAMFVVDHSFALRRMGYVMWDGRRVLEDEACCESIKKARQDTTPTFLTPGRLMNVARSWDQQFQAQQHPAVRPRGNRPRRRTVGQTASA